MAVAQRILRILALLLLLPAPLQALPRPDDGPAFAAALDAARSGDWQAAREAVAPIGVEAAAIAVEWLRLRVGAGFWEDYIAFLDRHPDWPEGDAIRRRGEAAIPAGADARQVIAYFADGPPETGAGVIHLAAAHASLGQTGDAEAEVVRAWRSLPMNAGDEALLLARWGTLLEGHHRARLDWQLWRGEEDAARRLLRHVGEDWRRLAEARLALRALAPDVDARIAAVPDDLADDPGLAYERFLWRIRKGRDDEAEEWLRARSVSAEALGEPQYWAGQRARLARAAMRAGDAARAYETAARHYLVEGADFADLEWLSGYLALRRLGQPELAVAHFTRLLDAVSTPISLGRAGYWLGRAHEASGNPSAAKIAYTLGAEHRTSFYGQLAAERADLPPDPGLAGTGPQVDWRETALAESPVLAAGLLFHHAGQPWELRRFLTHMADGPNLAQGALLGEVALELEEYNVALMVAKRLARGGEAPVRIYYPLTPLAREALPVPMELVMSIARRESEFDPAVVSPAGAMGLMQLMPATARAMATATGQQYSENRLLSDWQYNARLGAAYLARLIETYGNAPVLIAAAYNAGPSRADAWIAANGDPRQAESVEAVIDWIEHIPFTETRNYVMRVIESIRVYRARLSGMAEMPAIGALLISG